MMLAHHIHVGIRTHVDQIWWGRVHKVFSGHMEVQWPMVMAFHILKGNQNVTYFLVSFIMFMRTRPTHYHLESSGSSMDMEIPRVHNLLDHLLTRLHPSVH
jgi:hypothetical protein